VNRSEPPITKDNLQSESLERRINTVCNLSEAVVENTINKEIERMLKDGKSAEDIHDFLWLFFGDYFENSK
jgi:hypothetical protein